MARADAWRFLYYKKYILYIIYDIKSPMHFD